MQVQPTRCLYYAYSRATNLNHLKKATLLFGEITSVDAEPEFISKGMLKGTSGMRQDSLAELCTTYDLAPNMWRPPMIRQGAISTAGRFGPHCGPNHQYFRHHRHSRDTSAPFQIKTAR